MKIYANKSLPKKAIEFVLVSGNDYVAGPVSFTFSKPTDEGYLWKPSFELPIEVCEMLMEELWNMGIRPSSAESPGEVAALKKHIAFAEGVTTTLLSKLV
jgi:hypothetical protein